LEKCPGNQRGLVKKSGALPDWNSAKKSGQQSEQQPGKEAFKNAELMHGSSL
jgi:hypothetical protein